MEKDNGILCFCDSEYSHIDEEEKPEVRDVSPLLLSDTAQQFLGYKTPVNSTKASMYSMNLISQFNISCISTRKGDKAYKKLLEEAINVIRNVPGDIEDENSLLLILLN